MTMTAESKQHNLERLRRTGSGKLANILEAGADQEYADWYQQWQTDHPDAPSDKDYNYKMVMGKMPEPKDDGSLAFLPEEGWINRTRGGSWNPGAGASAAMLSHYNPSSYELNSKSWQAQNSLTRVVRKSMSNAYQHVVDSVYGDTFATTTTALGGYGGDKEKARADLMQAMTPDALELAQINESDTWAGAGETMGTLLLELGAYIGIGKGAMGRRKVAQTTGKIAKTAEKMVKTPKNKSLEMKPGQTAPQGNDTYSRGRMKDGLNNLVNRLEEAVDPGMVMGEYLYATADPETMSGALGETLEEWGYTGGLVDFLKDTDDDPYRRTVTNIVEGMIFFEALRTAARLGKYIPEKTLKSAMDFVTTKYDEAVQELDLLQRAMPTSMFGGTASIKNMQGEVRTSHGKLTAGELQANLEKAKSAGNDVDTWKEYG